MPRRKRKNKQNKPALTFTDSPVAIYRDDISPLHCANMPPTAEVVTLDEDIAVPWVSPQFRMQSAQAARQLKSRAAGTTQGGEESLLARSHISVPNPRLKPLQFAQLSDLNTSSPKEKEITGISENIIAVQPILRQGGPTLRQSEENKMEDEFTFIKTRGNSPAAELNDETAVNSGHARGREGCRKILYHDLNCSQADSEQNTAEDNGMKGDRLHKIVSTQDTLDFPVLGDASFHTPLHLPPTCPTVLQRQRLLDLAATPLSHTENLRPHTVLVDDTPVDDYGLSFRLRRLKSWR